MKVFCKINYPAASSGVSIRKLLPFASSGGELTTKRLEGDLSTGFFAKKMLGDILDRLKGKQGKIFSRVHYSAWREPFF